MENTEKSHLDLGNEYYKEGIEFKQQEQFNKAIVAFDQAIAEFKEMNEEAIKKHTDIIGHSYRSRGESYSSLGDHLSAIADFTESITLNKVDNFFFTYTYHLRAISYSILG